MNMMQESLKIYYCGREECDAGHSFGPATRNHYLMHFILKGKGTYEVKGETYSLEEGSVFLIKPQEVTLYKADLEEPWEYVWIAFEGEEAIRLLEETFGSQYINHWEKLLTGKEYLIKINQIYNEKGHNKSELLGWFYLIFSLFPVTKETVSSDYDYYKKAEHYIRHNYAYDIAVADIAKYIGIDRTYLFKIFKKYNAISPKQFLTNYRIRAAIDMLQYTNHSVTEIALSCGFHDSSVFCKNFIMKLGISPMKYRDKARLEIEENGPM